MSASTKHLLYTLPGFPNGLPEKDVLVRHAIEYFDRARPEQGMVGLSWEGENKKGERVLYHDLFITYNHDDKLERSDKYGITFKEEEIIVSTQPLGKNTGIVHEKAMAQLKSRITLAIESKHASLVQFKGLYTHGSTGEIILNKQKMFGWGLFKSDDVFLLRHLRNKSANINNCSVIYNQEYLYINFFGEKEFKIDVDFPQEYYLRRCLPVDISRRIHFVLKRQLPVGSKPGQEFCINKISKLENYPFEQNWKKLSNNSVAKIEALAETLDIFCGLEEKDYKRFCALHPGTDYIKNLLNLLKKNYKNSPKIQFSLEQVLEFAISGKDNKTPKEIVKKITLFIKQEKQKKVVKENKETTFQSLAHSNLFLIKSENSSPTTQKVVTPIRIYVNSSST